MNFTTLPALMVQKKASDLYRATHKDRQHIAQQLIKLGSESIGNFGNDDMELSETH